MKKERLIFNQELDQALNTCIYFKRDLSSYKAMDGYYIRDGKKQWCKAIWDSYLIDYYGDNLQAIKEMPSGFPRKEFEAFLRFLKKNGWEHSWYEPYPKAKEYMQENFSALAIKLLQGDYREAAE